MKHLVGIVVLCLLLVAPVLAQQGNAVAIGQIESIGIDNFYRPGDWVPMRVRVDAQSLDPGTYTVRIEQRDLDGQKVFWTRAVPITGATGTSGGQEKFEVYFMPDPLDGGLSDNPAELRRQLRVTLVDDDGAEVGLLQLPTPPRAADALYNSTRDVRLVVAVTPTPVPAGDYGDSGLRGIGENVGFLTVRPSDLPQSVLGYDMADAVLWGDFSVDDLDPVQRRALEEYVLRGGHLVIMQRPAEPQTVMQWGSMLPVTLTGTKQVALPGVFGDWAVEPNVRNDSNLLQPKVWPRVVGQGTLGTATPRGNAIVETVWDAQAQDPAPLIVRHTYGSGAVTWLGIDPVATPTLARVSRGWAGIWSRVFGWNDSPAYTDNRDRNNNIAEVYESAGPRDFGTALLQGMRQSGKSAALVGIALLFFVAYWLVAGPGIYLYLAAKKRTTLSWFAFGVAALLATVLTLGIVSLVLRGSPELAHVTLLRGSYDDNANGMALAQSSIGLYIPSDGEQELALAGFDETNLSTVTPYIGHPFHYDQPRSSSGNYEINVRTAGEVGVGAATVPFRSTLKKLETVWRGELGDPGAVDALPRIEGSARLAPTGRTPLSGKLLNVTGQDLTGVWIAYRRNLGVDTWWDELLYVPQWTNGTELDLQTATAGTEQSRTYNILEQAARPFGTQRIVGRLDLEGHWPAKLPFLRGNALSGGSRVDTLDASTILLLSFFDRFPVIRNDQTGRSRIDPRRLNARDYDMSNALLSGSLVVVGIANNAPMPVPFTVDGDAVQGAGMTVYQFAIPLTRPAATATPDTTTRASE